MSTNRKSKLQNRCDVIELSILLHASKTECTACMFGLVMLSVFAREYSAFRTFFSWFTHLFHKKSEAQFTREGGEGGGTRRLFKMIGYRHHDGQHTLQSQSKPMLLPWSSYLRRWREYDHGLRALKTVLISTAANVQEAEGSDNIRAFGITCRHLQTKPKYMANVREILNSTEGRRQKYKKPRKQK